MYERARIKPLFHSPHLSNYASTRFTRMIVAVPIIAARRKENERVAGCVNGRERERKNDFMEADFIALLDIGTMSLERDISIVSNVEHFGDFKVLFQFLL